MLECGSQVISQIELKLYNASRTLWSSENGMLSVPPNLNWDLNLVDIFKRLF